MRVAIGKIEGVTSATVSLNEGLTTVQFAPVNRVTIEQIREVIRDNGFTPKQAEVRVAGVLVRRGDTLALAIPGTEEALSLQDVPGAPSQLDRLRQLGPNEHLTIIGHVAATDRSAKSPRILLVRCFTTG